MEVYKIHENNCTIAAIDLSKVRIINYDEDNHKKRPYVIYADGDVVARFAKESDRDCSLIILCDRFANLKGE